MLTTLFYHWCEWRFLATGIPCPSPAIQRRRNRGVAFQLIRKNQLGYTSRFEIDQLSGNITAVVEEWS